MNSPRSLVAVVLPALLVVSTACLQGDRRIATRAPGADGGTGTPFVTPSMINGLRSTTDALQDPTLSADELEIYFVCQTDGDRNLWRSQRATPTDPWQEATRVGELSSTAQDEDPELARDGLTLYFSSDRAEGSGAMRLWFSRRASRTQMWEPPQQIMGLGDSDADIAPSVDSAGLHLVFASMRDGPDFHLYLTSRPSLTTAWGVAQPLVAANSDQQDRDPALYNGGNALIFASRRTDEGRTSDIFQITGSGPAGVFEGPAAAIVELNTDVWEGDPWMSESGRHILFVSDRTGTPRIYEAWR